MSRRGGGPESQRLERVWGDQTSSGDQHCHDRQDREEGCGKEGGRGDRSGYRHLTAALSVMIDRANEGRKAEEQPESRNAISYHIMFCHVMSCPPSMLCRSVVLPRPPSSSVAFSLTLLCPLSLSCLPCLPSLPKTCNCNINRAGPSFFSLEKYDRD